MAQTPAPKQWHNENNQHQKARNNDCAPDFGLGRKIFEELEEKEEIPFGPSRRIVFGCVSRSTELRAKPAVRGREIRLHDQEENCGEHSKTGDGILQNLVGPEGGVWSALGEFGGDSLSAEKVDVATSSAVIDAGRTPACR